LRFDSIGVMIASMHRGAFALALVASLSGPLAAQPAGQSPTGSWFVHYEDDRCIATHEYRANGQDWIVALEPRATTDQTSIMLVAPSVAGDLAKASVRVGGTPIAASGMSLDSRDSAGRRLYSAPLSPAELARLTTSGSLQFEHNGQATSFALAKLPVVQQQLAACVQDLLASWGLSTKQQAALGSFPALARDPEAHVSAEDRREFADRLPSASHKATVLVQVDQTGLADECTVTKSTGDAQLDAETCRIFVDRVQYKAARDRNGKPVKAPLVSSLTWATR
jgi:hypothetical protein